MDSKKLQVRMATESDREWIYQARHRVYAEELGQHDPRPDGRLSDGLDDANVYVVVASGDTRVGFVSLTPPWQGRYSLDKYLTRDELPVLDEDVFEVRVLTVEPDWRRDGVATLLMYAALRWVVSRGGRTIVAMGRSDLTDMYRAVGFELTGRTITSGAAEFEVMTASTSRATALALGPFAGTVEGWRRDVEWQVDAPFGTGPDGCEHGGASFTAIGTDFRDLARREQVVAADVLDAWFPPAPGVRAALATDTSWLARTSPPTDAAGLIAEISSARGLPAASLAVGSGSSDLIFRAFTRWLTPRSRVLLVEPGYGEYAHVTEKVVGCQVDRFRVRREDDWTIDTTRLVETVRATPYDLVVVVNPNNPTGRHLPGPDLRDVIARTPESTSWWIDEAYIGYVDLAESLADLAADSPNVVVCSSLSKMYALSGVRAAYLVAAPGVAAEIRLRTPPWQVSLPAQLAAVAALRDPDHYRARWHDTHTLRRNLARSLTALGDLDVDESVANFVNVTLPVHGPSAHQLVTHARQHGVYLRDLSPMSPGYEGRTVRIAVRDSPENHRMVAACESALHAVSPWTRAAASELTCCVVRPDADGRHPRCQ